jgi:hypothetical protein
MSHNQRRSAARAANAEGVEFRSTDATVVDLHQNLSGSGNWGRHLGNLQGIPAGIKEGFHWIINPVQELHDII